MNKTVVKVFVIVGILVGVFIAWQLIFNDGGILRTGYNAVADGVNTQWGKITGSTIGKNGEGGVMAKWGDSNADDNGQGFQIDREKK